MNPRIHLLKRFRKKVVKSGVLSTVRRKRWFVSKSEQRRMEKKKAIRRIKRRYVSRISSRPADGTGGCMAKEEDKIQVEGLVIEALPEPSSGCGWITDTKFWPIFRARCASIISASCWGISVKVEMSPYDLTRGRITFRQKKSGGEPEAVE